MNDKQIKQLPKIVWALVSIEVPNDENDDEVAMDYVNDALVETGFIVDDMGIKEITNE